MIKPMNFTKEKPKGKLDILCSARVRLRDDQRKLLKDAYNSVRNANTPEPLAAIGGSTVKTSTTYQINSHLALSDITIRDLINTRESIQIVTVLSLQAALGVEALTKEEVMKAFQGYCDYIFLIGNDGQ